MSIYDLLTPEQWAKAPRQCVLALASQIPKVGEAISALLGALWPETKQDLIAESEERMKLWVKGEFAAYDRARLRDALAGLRRNLKEYIGATTPASRLSWLDVNLGVINDNVSHFMDPRDYPGSLSLTRELATIHLALLKERVSHTQEIFGTTDNASYRRALAEQIKEYQTWVHTKAYPAVLQWRADQMTITNPDFSHNYYRLVDYARNVDAGVASMTIANQYREYFLNDAHLDLMRNTVDVADAWSHLDPEYHEKCSIPRDRMVWIGPIGLSQWDYQHNQHDYPLVNGLGHMDPPGRITKIVLKEGVIVDFINFHYDWGRSPRWIGNAKGGTLRTIEVPPGENIRQVDTYWNYTCMGIEFHYTNGAKSGVFGRKEQPRPRDTALHRAGYPDHLLRSVAVYGLPSPEYRNALASGISEIYYGFAPDPRLYA